MVTKEQNLALTLVLFATDIKETIFNMFSNSALIADGFTRKFFQVAWDIVRTYLCIFVRHFLISGTLPEIFNSNFMVLIPKVEQAIRIEQFRPIMLRNFIFKVVTNIIATRLGIVTSKVLASNKFGFILGRNMHYIALTSEFVNSMEKRRTKSHIAFKVYMKKAFDKVK